MANSASGPAWTPEEVVTVTRVDLVARDLQGGAELLAGAGVAGLHPAQARRAAGEVDEPLAGAAGDPEHDLGALERVLPARVVERDAALADRVADPAPGRQQLGEVGQLDAVLGGDPLRVLAEHRRGDHDLHAAPPGNSNSSSDSAFMAAEYPGCSGAT